MNVDEARPVEDRYEVIKQLGEGASAETYLAKDKHNGDQLVAIKSLRVEKIEGWKFFELFEREAQTLATLSHSGVPDFVESFASKDADGRPRFHLVQEYVEGRSLETIIEEGGLTETEFDQLVLGLLDVLDYLHSRKPPIFHRDIKPSNIIVRPMGAPVLLDFGSVCYGWREEMERGSTVAGTHGYMPPEQYLGQVSPRSDLYGLGATLLHVATGKSPSEFSFDSGKLEVPDTLPVRANVRTAITQMLEPAPKDRPDSARDVRALLIGEPSTGLALAAPFTALVPVRKGGIVINRDPDAPKFLDLGPPPRDPKDPALHDVYYTLLPKMTSMTFGVPASSRAGKQSQFLLWLVLMLCTFGVLAIAPWLNNEERSRRRFLFIEGHFTRATVIGASAVNQQQTRVSYEFETDGSRYRGSSNVVPSDGSHLVDGDVMGVLYDPDEPSNSVLVYE